MAGRRQHTSSFFLRITGLFLKACPMGEPQSETICIIANRKCSGHRRILPRHPAWCNFRYHNYSTHELIFLPSGIGCNPWPVFCFLYASPPDCQKISLHYSVHFFCKNRGAFWKLHKKFTIYPVRSGSQKILPSIQCIFQEKVAVCPEKIQKNSHRRFYPMVWIYGDENLYPIPVTLLI